MNFQGISSQAVISSEKAEPPLVLALDIGTSSMRALLFDRLGRMVEGISGRQPAELHILPDGTAVMPPDRLLESIFTCLDAVCDQVKRLSLPIASVGCCTFVSNVLGVDASGRAVTPLYTYADTRDHLEAALLRQRPDAGLFHQRTGCVFHTSYLPARFLWLENTQPEVFQAAVRWVSLGEYLMLKLFGDAAVSYAVASWTGLLNRQSLDWDDDLLALLPIRRQALSSLVDVDLPRQGLQGEWADRFPLLRDIPWYPAIGDGVTANLGSGCVSAQQVAITMGTTTAVRVVMPGSPAQIPAGLWCYRVDRDHSLLGGALTEGGNIFDWLRQVTRLDDIPDLEAALSQRSPGQHGLNFLPLLSGERAPGWRGEARGAITGLSLATTPLDLLQAGLEGLALRVALVESLLRPVFTEEPFAVASGGSLRYSPALLHMIAGALGKPVLVSDVPEASARGTAMLALRSLGEAADLLDFPRFYGQTYQPDMARHAQYQRLLEKQRDLYHTLYP